MHFPYGLSFLIIFGLYLFVLNFSTSSKNSFFNTSSEMFKNFAIFGMLSSIKKPLPCLHPTVQDSHLHGCDNFKTSIIGAFFVNFTLWFFSNAAPLCSLTF